MQYIRKMRYPLFLIILLIGCGTKSRRLEELKSEMSNRATYFDKVKMDSVHLSKNYLRVFLTDSIDYASLRQTQIAAWTMMPLNQFPEIVVDTLQFSFHMPLRDSIDFEIKSSKTQIQDWLKESNDPLAHSRLNAVLEENRKNAQYLDYLNFLFADVAYGDRAVDSAFFGLDAMGIITAAVQECKRRSNPSINVQLIAFTVYQRLAADPSEFGIATKQILSPLIDSCRLAYGIH